MSIKKSILSLLFTYCTVETSKKSIQLPWKNYMLRLAIDNKNLPPSIFGLDTMKYRRRITCRVSLWIKNCSSHFFWFGISEQKYYTVVVAKRSKNHSSHFIWFGNSKKEEKTAMANYRFKKTCIPLYLVWKQRKKREQKLLVADHR